VRTAICALTYLRPEGLRRLLDGLDQLDPVPPGELVVFIVDNDPAGSARVVVDQHDGRLETVYVHEATRGISAARNAGVDAARTWQADVLCFIDDDEWPEPSWLNELVSTHLETSADVVTGPVLPVFVEPPPAWVIDGGFFERPRHGHNEQIPYATTSSVLISLDCLSHVETPFDPAFGLSGGEDTHLFAQLREAGNRIVWCDRATVYEAIPPSKVTERWLLRREYRRGQTLSLSLRARDRRPSRLVRRVGNGIVQILTGSFRAAVGAVRGKAHWFNGVTQVAFGCGMLTGLTGRRYQEYTTTHGA
jgi:glycosyltransferase involved in cell wall biosynthesis